jgi:sporulation protein YtfJ
MHKEKVNNRIRDLMSTAMKELNSIIDVNTVIGEPVKVDETTSVIPITKVTMGFMTGGGEYGKVKTIKSDNSAPFAGGSGAVLSLKPSGFLIERKSGVQLLSVADDAFSRIIESVDNFIKSYKNEDNK